MSAAGQRPHRKFARRCNSRSRRLASARMCVRVRACVCARVRACARARAFAASHVFLQCRAARRNQPAAAATAAAAAAATASATCDVNQHRRRRRHRRTVFLPPSNAPTHTPKRVRTRARRATCRSARRLQQSDVSRQHARAARSYQIAPPHCVARHRPNQKPKRNKRSNL